MYHRPALHAQAGPGFALASSSSCRAHLLPRKWRMELAACVYEDHRPRPAVSVTERSCAQDGEGEKKSVFQQSTAD